MTTSETTADRPETAERERSGRAYEPVLFHLGAFTRRSGRQMGWELAVVLVATAVSVYFARSFWVLVPICAFVATSAWGKATRHFWTFRGVLELKAFVASQLPWSDRAVVEMLERE